MTATGLLADAFRDFAGMSEAAFALPARFWQQKHYRKDEFFNEYKNVCRHPGFIHDGVFRTFYVDEAAAEERAAIPGTDSTIPRHL